MAQPVEARVGQAVLQEVWVRRHTHHIQLTLLQLEGPNRTRGSFRGWRGIAGLFQGGKERAFPHGPKVMLAEGFGLAFDEGALVLPACMPPTFYCCLAFSQHLQFWAGEAAVGRQRL